MLYMRAIPGKMRTDKVYVAAFDLITFINIGFNASKRGTRSAAVQGSAAAEGLVTVAVINKTRYEREKEAHSGKRALVLNGS